MGRVVGTPSSQTSVVIWKVRLTLLPMVSGPRDLGECNLGEHICSFVDVLLSSWAACVLLRSSLSPSLMVSIVWPLLESNVLSLSVPLKLRHYRTGCIALRLCDANSSKAQALGRTCTGLSICAVRPIPGMRSSCCTMLSGLTTTRSCYPRSMFNHKKVGRDKTVLYIHRPVSAFWNAHSRIRLRHLESQHIADEHCL